MTIQIGLVGCGRWGKNILRDLLLLGCQVHIYDNDSAACKLALEKGASSAVTDFPSFSADCDGYVVATPTVNHFESISRLLKRGQPIFCEKPLTSDRKSARELASKDKGQIFLMDKWCYHPGIEALAELAHSGELGEIQQLRTRRVQWGQPHEDVDGVWILAPHDLCIVKHIIGHLPKVITAVGDYSGERMDGLLAILGDGPVAIIEVSSRQPVPDRLVSVSFEHGVAWLAGPLDDHICVLNQRPGTVINPGNYEERSINTEWPLFLELKRFVDFLTGGPPPYTNVDSAVLQVELIEHLREIANRTI